ncbi:diaminopropionate ammonia-lyase [Aidingimonas halophila]|uniref:Diaminopropionate ammonia-lyase n=1 Tax=Aidingimonas halophila TaxID=574349 RepID=A0A1H3GC47_9GAMM|nr:diaminopropionate ammonia-lyase [Aidingimonas halophila]GHC32799.1 PLP-dependent lyase/thiolase [Aidingimonas halophila]SDX99909.1 diaminopropionate ammonia-lyase [Aidingimonas halophila]
MSQLIHDDTIEHHANARVCRDTAFAKRLRAVLTQQDMQMARDEIRTWPGYHVTPLVELSGIAKRANIADIHYKDEDKRFDLHSFKALGGAYAVLRLLKRQLPSATTEELLAGTHRDAAAHVTVCCATDGNHGRSVAWGAHLFGVGCVIYLHHTVSHARESAIRRFGAEVRRVQGNYDDAIRQAAKDADTHGWFVVSDTSYPGYMSIPRDVMQGYTVMIDEAVQQLPQVPTHCFIQGGVGGLAAATVAQLWEAYGDRCPRIIVVEPDRAACLIASAREGRPTPVHGDLDTLMAGLACGETSLLAWEILDQGVDDYLTITDNAAVEAMRLLAEGIDGDPPLVAGESAVAGLAGLLIARQDDALSARLGLDIDSRVLLIGSEGATDQALYEQLIGRAVEDIDTGATQHA